MNRSSIQQDILNIFKKNILVELPTGVGKSKIALDLLTNIPQINNILIVIPRLVLINNWKEEFIKWGYQEMLNKVTFVTYVSFPKLSNTPWSVIIYDECHHLSERCRNSLPYITSEYNILLSATVNKNMKYELLHSFPDLSIYKVRTREAIEENILPDPKVILIPLYLDNKVQSYQIIKNPKCKNQIVINYIDRWKYKDVKNVKIIIKCTQQEYYSDLTSLIEWYKKKNYLTAFKNLFLKKSGDRLKWLSLQKTDYIQHILSLFLDKRVLTFCSSIEQTEQLGRYCINSKNDKAQIYLNKFNRGEINHITACNMLDEGINLSNCQIGVYAALNSSDRLIVQKLGRLLRHDNPIIILPYFVGTRDEEIVNKMCENYNKDLIIRTTLNKLTSKLCNSIF